MRGRIFKLALALFAAALFIPNPFWRAGMDAAALAALAVHDAGVLSGGGSLKFWIFPAAFVALAPFFSGNMDAAISGHTYSFPQLASGSLFLLHAWVFVSLCAFAARNFTAGEIIAAAEKAGFSGLGLRAALALTSARMLRRMLAETWFNYRCTRPSWKEALFEFDVLSGAVLRNTAAAAENIAVLLHIRNVKV
ncbi:MAG: hypothetical protein PHP45_06530 [Elusimicrobiales bacterium]|nr:hypothetical protein [Elusimicrobiales bacterium]